MRSFFIVIAIALMSSIAMAGIRLFPTGGRFEFTDCAAAGSAAQTVKIGTYLTRFITEDIWVCYAATCASPNGEKFGAGTVMMLTFTAAQSVSCRSTGATGDLVLTRADQ